MKVHLRCGLTLDHPFGIASGVDAKGRGIDGIFDLNPASLEIGPCTVDQEIADRIFAATLNIDLDV